MDSDLGNTIIALEGGVANLNPHSALQDVEGWRTRLDGADLQELALRLSRADLKDIGEVLARLGQWTQATVPYAPDEYKEDLQRLGDVLNEAASQAI